MKRRIICIAASVLLLLIIPTVMASAAVSVQGAFSKTYYAELPVMYERLKSTDGKKVVFIGNSAIAFGVRSDLLETELEGYSVVNFGLYGAVGTKAMLDLAEDNIAEGDIVIIIPELYAQTASLYFSPKDVYRSIDGNFDMLRCLIKNNRPEMIAGFIPYAAEKFSYRDGGPDAEGAYSKAAFEDKAGNDVGYMTYLRSYNEMPGGYDSANLPIISKEVYGEGFIDYLNAFAQNMRNKGARVLYAFPPLNELALGKDSLEKADNLYDYLRTALDFEILAHPAKYTLDYRWFYDNNVHLNSAGAYKYTSLLAEDLKILLGMDMRCAIEVPEPPEMPILISYSGDNRDADLFMWEKCTDASGDYINLTGLTEEGQKATELIVPSDYDGIPVRSFSTEVFSGNTNIARIILPKNITTIYDYSFMGADRLTELVFMHDSILSINVGLFFLDGADNCYIYVNENVSLSDCAGGWERYQPRIRTMGFE